MKLAMLNSSKVSTLSSFRSHKTQKGITLIVALIMVLLMTIVALSSIRGSGLQEAMATNLKDRNVALQACEYGIRDAESKIDPTVKVLPNFDGTNGMYLDLDKNNRAGSVLFMTNAQWKALAAASVTSLPGTADQPLYIVEEISVNRNLCGALYGNSLGPGNCPTPYRISCYGAGMTTDAGVIAQSIFRRLD